MYKICLSKFKDQRNGVTYLLYQKSNTIQCTKKMQKYPYQWKILIKKHVVPNKMFVSESGISDQIAKEYQYCKKNIYFVYTRKNRLAKMSTILLKN